VHVSHCTAYEATLGIGAIHLPIGNPPEEDAGDGNVELYHAKVAAMIGMHTFYGNGNGKGI
jgi:hypothetical protein